MTRRLVEEPKQDTTYSLTNPSRLPTTSWTVGRLFGFALQHFSMNSKLFSSLWTDRSLPLNDSNGDRLAPHAPGRNIPGGHSTANIANAKTSADSDVVGGLELVLVGGSTISGTSHQEDRATPGIDVILSVRFKVVGGAQPVTRNCLSVPSRSWILTHKPRHSP